MNDCFAWLSDRPCAQVLQEAVVRKGFHASSEQCASLQARPRFHSASCALPVLRVGAGAGVGVQVGSVVTAFELHLNEDGNPRIRCEEGWANVVSSEGVELLQAV